MPHVVTEIQTGCLTGVVAGLGAMPRRRDYPRPRGQADDPGSSAISAILNTHTTEEVGDAIGVHSTMVGRYTYGARPSARTVKRLHKKWPEHITDEVIAHWGYRPVDIKR